VRMCTCKDWVITCSGILHDLEKKWNVKGAFVGLMKTWLSFICWKVGISHGVSAVKAKKG